MRLKEIGGKLEASKTDESGRTTFPVVIISQGLGNLSDKNYYSKDAIQSGVQVYEGKKAYFDHPTPTGEREMPNRSVRDIAGHYENVKAEEDEYGLMALKADFVPMSGSKDVTALLEHAVEYKKKYPDRDYVGISINGDGEGAPMEWQEFLSQESPTSEEMKKLKQVEGMTINVIKKLTDAVSADLVTEPGARGRVLLEQEKKEKRRKNMIEQMRKLLAAVSKKDKKLAEDAVKGMLQDEMGDKKEGEGMSEADSLVKHLLAAKKEMKKNEGESEEAYEARCAKEAVERMHKEASEGKKEGVDQKQDGEGSEKDEMPAKKAEGDEADKKESDEHPDEKQDKDLISKMMAKMEQIEAKMEAMMGEKKESEDKHKEAKESEAGLKVEKKLRERAQLIDTLLGQSGLPRMVTKELKPVLEACKSEQEIKDTSKRLFEAAEKTVEAYFHSTERFGLTEATKAEDGTTDHLFK